MFCHYNIILNEFNCVFLIPVRENFKGNQKDSTCLAADCTLSSPIGAIQRKGILFPDEMPL